MCWRSEADCQPKLLQVGETYIINSLSKYLYNMKILFLTTNLQTSVGDESSDSTQGEMLDTRQLPGLWETQFSISTDTQGITGRQEETEWFLKTHSNYFHRKISFASVKRSQIGAQDQFQCRINLSAVDLEEPGFS